MLSKFTEYAEEMRARVKLGSFVACCAIALTLASVVALAIESIREHEKQGDTVGVWLAPPTAAAVGTACKWLPSTDVEERVGRRVVASVTERDSAKPIVVLTLRNNRDKVRSGEKERCNGNAVRVRRASILATD